MTHDQLTAQAALYAASRAWEPQPGKSLATMATTAAGTSLHRALEAVPDPRDFPGLVDLINQPTVPLAVCPAPTVTTFLTGACW